MTHGLRELKGIRSNCLMIQAGSLNYPLKDTRAFRTFMPNKGLYLYIVLLYAEYATRISLFGLRNFESLITPEQERVRGLTFPYSLQSFSISIPPEATLGMITQRGALAEPSSSLWLRCHINFIYFTLNFTSFYLISPRLYLLIYFPPGIGTLGSAVDLKDSFIEAFSRYLSSGVRNTNMTSSFLGLLRSQT